jgi:nitroimidazol reductase NimA-like FMN-containing flavoprotein (pyridoxamine 5'-phosphate oxidase superfamily)
MSDLHELPVEKCRELLEANILGRVAVCTPSGPQIRPVNYAVVDDAVVFRTSPLTELAVSGWATEMAFEIDHVDYEGHRGWSVVATGRAEIVDDPDEVARIRSGWQPRPWASGSRTLYVRLPWRQLTGRRIGGGWTPENETPVRRRV